MDIISEDTRILSQPLFRRKASFREETQPILTPKRKSQLQLKLSPLLEKSIIGRKEVPPIRKFFHSLNNESARNLLKDEKEEDEDIKEIIPKTPKFFNECSSRKNSCESNLKNKLKNIFQEKIRLNGISHRVNPNKIDAFKEMKKLINSQIIDSQSQIETMVKSVASAIGPNITNRRTYRYINPSFHNIEGKDILSKTEIKSPIIHKPKENTPASIRKYIFTKKISQMKTLKDEGVDLYSFQNKFFIGHDLTSSLIQNENERNNSQMKIKGRFLLSKSPKNKR